MTALLTLNNVSMCFRSKEGQRHTVFDGIDLRLDRRVPRSGRTQWLW